MPAASAGTKCRERFELGSPVTASVHSVRTSAGRSPPTTAGRTWDKLRFEQLSELAFAFDGKAGLRPSDFVDHVRSERVESPSGAQVRVMTIHGAKGLEFDAVILPELHKKFVGRRAGPLVDRPRPDGLIQTVSVSPRKETLAADEDLMALYEETTARMFEDGLCTLYVAMTRAARRLDLIVPWSDPEKEIKIPCAADLVRAAMPQDDLHAPDAAGVIWSHPTNAPGAGWAKGLEPDSGESERPEPALTQLGLAPSDRPRTLPRRSPSSEEGGRLVRAEALFRDKRGAKRGTLIHRWLEDLVWIEDFHLDEARALDIGVPLEPNPETRREALAALTRALQAEPVRSALSRERCGAPADAALEVSNEHTFSVVLADDSGEEQLWSGSIDRLVLGRRGDDVVWAEVLDYKIGHPDRGAASRSRRVLPAAARDVRTCGGSADGAGCFRDSAGVGVSGAWAGGGDPGRGGVRQGLGP